MNISLIYPLLSRSRSLTGDNKQYWPPLGIAYIAAVLEQYNHKVKILDRDVILRKNRMDFEKVDEITLKEIESFGADMIGISATTPNMGDEIHISSLIKKRNPGLKIVLGGPHATCEPVLTLQKCRDIDVVVRSEGEFTMLNLANGLELRRIEGITFRDGNRLISNPDRPLCSDLDKLPYPAWHLLDMKFYSKPNVSVGRGLNLRSTSVFSSRGCPYRCDFCAGHIMFPGKVRFHSPQRMIEEMEHLVDSYSIEAIYFADDMFLSSRKRTAEFLQLLVENEKLNKIKWIAQARADVVDETILKSLKRAGCVHLEYGFESGSQRMLDIMNKRSTVEDNVRAATLTRKAGLRFSGFIMVGYPGETEADFEKTVKFLKKVRPTVISFIVFFPLPGTAVYKNLLLQNQSIPEWDAIGDPEAAGTNYADMDKAKFERLYSKTKLTLVLPNNLYYFMRDNIYHPIRFVRTFLTHGKGMITKSVRAMRRLLAK